jgi:hypothetical protein
MAVFSYDGGSHHSDRHRPGLRTGQPSARPPRGEIAGRIHVCLHTVGMGGGFGGRVGSADLAYRGAVHGLSSAKVKIPTKTLTEVFTTSYS